MRHSIAAACGAIALLMLPAGGHATNLTPPEVASTTGEPLVMRLSPGFQSQCNRTSVSRRYLQPPPTTQTSSYGNWVEKRKGSDFMGIVVDFEGAPISLVFELTQSGAVKNAPPSIETNIPGFERRYGAEMRQLAATMLGGMAGNYLGREFEIGKDYGPTMDLCLMTGQKAAGWPEGTTIVKGSLTFEGRPSHLVTQTLKQSCSSADGTLSFESSAWGVYEKASGQLLRSASEFSAFSKNGRIARVEEFTNCTITQR